MSFSNAEQCRITIRIDNGPVAQATSNGDAPTRFWSSFRRTSTKPEAIGDPEERRQFAADCSKRLHRSFGAELHRGLASYRAGDARPNTPGLFFFAVDDPDRWEFSSLTFGVVVFGVGALLESFDNDVELLGALLHAIVPQAFGRVSGLAEADCSVTVNLEKLRDAAHRRGGEARTGGASGVSGAEKHPRSSSEILQRTPMVLGILIALVAGYVAGGTRQEEHRRWAETEAKVFEQQNELLASCTSERNQVATACRDEKQQVANEHLELIKAYKERDEACRAAATFHAPAPSSSTALPQPPH